MIKQLLLSGGNKHALNFMSYSNSKSAFEAVINNMQKDLQSYAASEKGNQRVIDVRLNIMNRLVAYYQEAEKLISDLEMQKDEWYFHWSKLHRDTTRLVQWCLLHHINPNPALRYTKEELQLLIQKGRRFGRPGDYDLPEETLEEIIAGSTTCKDFLKDQNQYFENCRACL